MTTVRRPKETGGIIPFRNSNGHASLLLGRNFHKHSPPHTQTWSPFASVTVGAESVSETAVRAFASSLGVDPTAVKIENRQLLEVLEDESVVFKNSSEIERATYYLVDVSAADSGFPTVTKIKEMRTERARQLKKAHSKEDSERARMLRATLAKDDYRWVSVELLSKLVVYDTKYHEEDVCATCDGTGESFLFDKDFLNVLKENNTWGKPFLAFCRKYKP